MNPADSKIELRRRLRAQRRALSADAQQRAALELATQLAATRWFRASRQVAAYIVNDGEIDPAAAVDRLRRARRQLYLPVLSPLPHDRLWFARFDADTPLTRNRLNIWEPLAAPRELRRARALDLILLPLVAFDGTGNRLGMGGGFYDRSLAFLRGRRHWRRPYIVGLAHEFQRVRSLTPDPWDVPLDGIVTDAAIYVFD